MGCSYDDCEFECYESYDKCIFHYDKKDWLTPARQDWKVDAEDKIKYFWTEIRRLKLKINNQYDGYFFPRFEEFTLDIEYTVQGKIEIRDHTYIDNIYFGYRNSYHSYYYYALLENASFNDAIFMDDVDFSKISLEGNTSFNNVVFKKGIKFSCESLNNIIFDNVIFEEDMDFVKLQINNCKFINIEFKNNINFLESQFNNVDFKNSQFNNIIDFSNINLNGTSTFNKVIFKGKANFENGSFGAVVNFEESVFEKDAIFTQRECKGNANFKKAIIQGNALFDVKSIQAEADFSEVIFEDESTFKDVEISGDVNFSNAVFKGKVSFENGSFGANANFEETRFEETTLFSGHEFKGKVNFSKSIFIKVVSFEKGNFEADSNFSEAEFEDDVIFTQSKINGAINFHTKVNYVSLLGEREYKKSIKGKVYFDVAVMMGNVDFSGRKFEDDFIFTNVKVSGESDFSQSNFKKDVYFQGSIFANLINFRGCYVNGNLNFSKAVFQGKSEFSHINIEGQALFSSTLYEDELTFESSNFENDLLFDGVICQGEIKAERLTVQGIGNFLKGSFEGKVDFSHSHFFNDLIFSYKIFTENIKFFKINVDGNCYFDSLHIEKDFLLKESVFKGDLICDDSIIKGISNFTKLKVMNKTFLIDCSFENDIDFSKSKFMNDMFFSNCVFKTNFYFNNIEAKNIDFSNAYFLENRTGIVNETEYLLEINNSFFYDVYFFKSIIGKNMICKSCSFESLLLQENTFKNNINIIFKDIKVNTFSINEYINESENILFDSVSVLNKLMIKHISFDKERFNHFNISKANVEIENSTFNDNFFNSVKWGTISEKRYKASRDIFRQLKFYSEKQKNFIDADGFYSLEMREQKKELREENKEIETWWGKISHFFTNTLVFYLHEKTSDFSQNWWLPIFWLIIVGMGGIIYKNIEKIDLAKSFFMLLVGLILYSMMYYGYKSITAQKKLPNVIIYILIFFPFIWTYSQVSTDYFNDIAKLLNPSNIFKPIVLEKKHEFISLLYKILVLFLVYQVISAIKKKVRSK